MPIADDQPSNKWFQDLIRSAALAGSCSIWARREPAAARGLARYAERQRSLAGPLIDKIWLDAGCPYRKAAGVRASAGSGGGIADAKG